MPIPSPKEGGKSKRKFTWKSWHRKRWKARANTKRKKAHAAALLLLKESLAVCSLRQSYSWECQSHPPFNSLLLSTPPHPEKKKPPKIQNKPIPSKTKTQSFDKTKSVTDSKPSLPFFFPSSYSCCALAITCTVSTTRAPRYHQKLPQRGKQTTDGLSTKTSSTAGEERRVVNNIKFKT